MVLDEEVGLPVGVCDGVCGGVFVTDLVMETDFAGVTEGVNEGDTPGVKLWETAGVTDGDGPGVTTVPMVAFPVRLHACPITLPVEVLEYSNARRSMIVCSTGRDMSSGHDSMPLQPARSLALLDKGESASLVKYV